MYYNTVNEEEQLEQYINAAAQQDSAVWELFLERDMLSASEAHRLLGTTAPITSIRRSINTLTAKGLLVKTQDKVKGAYGRDEYVWRVRRSGD